MGPTVRWNVIRGISQWVGSGVKLGPNSGNGGSGRSGSGKGSLYSKIIKANNK